MKAVDMTNLYVGYNKEEDFRILICSVEGEYGAQRLADEYALDSGMEEESFEISEFNDIDTHFDCDYVIM
jgi:hypothetical protein